MGYFQGWGNAVDAGNAFGWLQDKVCSVCGKKFSPNSPNQKKALL